MTGTTDISAKGTTASALTASLAKNSDIGVWQSGFPAAAAVDGNGFFSASCMGSRGALSVTPNLSALKSGQTLVFRAGYKFWSSTGIRAESPVLTTPLTYTVLASATTLALSAASASILVILF